MPFLISQNHQRKILILFKIHCCKRWTSEFVISAIIMTNRINLFRIFRRWLTIRLNLLMNFFFQFQPNLISLSFCFSFNSDVSMMFRRHGIFSEMIITHDIRCITGRPDATLSQQQSQLISLIGRKFIVKYCLNILFQSPDLRKTVCS